MSCSGIFEILLKGFGRPGSHQLFPRRKESKGAAGTRKTQAELEGLGRSQPCPYAAPRSLVPSCLGVGGRLPHPCLSPASCPLSSPLPQGRLSSNRRGRWLGRAWGLPLAIPQPRTKSSGLPASPPQCPPQPPCNGQPPRRLCYSPANPGSLVGVPSGKWLAGPVWVGAWPWDHGCRRLPSVTVGYRPLLRLQSPGFIPPGPLPGGA